jgi:hypothetical protein
MKRDPGTSVVAAALMLTAFSLGAGGQVVRSAEFKPDPEGMPGERQYDRTVDVGRGIRLPVTIEVTVRRNGTLKVANLEVRVLDEYDDGQVYEGGLLHVEFVDVTGDGLKDLVITGIVTHTGAKEGDPVTREPVTSVYVFVPDKSEFRRTFHCGPEIEMPRPTQERGGKTPHP